MVVRWLSLLAPNDGRTGSIPDEGIRFHMPHLRPSVVKKRKLKLKKKKSRSRGIPGTRQSMCKGLVPGTIREERTLPPTLRQPCSSMGVGSVETKSITNFGEG